MTVLVRARLDAALQSVQTFLGSRLAHALSIFAVILVGLTLFAGHRPLLEWATPWLVAVVAVLISRLVLANTCPATIVRKQLRPGDSGAWRYLRGRFRRLGVRRVLLNTFEAIVLIALLAGLLIYTY